MLNQILSYGTIAAVAAIISGWRVGVLRKRRRYEAVVARWEKSPATDRGTAMEALLNGSVPNAAAWYLAGAAQLREGHIRRAARAFGIAHHSDARLESAALLTFACLKAREGPSSDLLEQIARTWIEMKRPDLAASMEDRRILKCLLATTPEAPPLSLVGQLAWSVVSPAEQAQMGMLINDAGCEWARVLRSDGGAGSSF